MRKYSDAASPLSALQGVNKSSRPGHWEAVISDNGKRRFLGCFTSAEEAAYVYAKEFARIGGAAAAAAAAAATADIDDGAGGAGDGDGGAPSTPSAPPFGGVPCWIQCEECRKWRRLHGAGLRAGEGDATRWTCELNNDGKFSVCEVRPHMRESARSNRSRDPTRPTRPTRPHPSSTLPPPPPSRLLRPLAPGRPRAGEPRGRPRPLQGRPRAAAAAPAKAALAGGAPARHVPRAAPRAGRQEAAARPRRRRAAARPESPRAAAAEAGATPARLGRKPTARPQRRRRLVVGPHPAAVAELSRPLEHAGRRLRGRRLVRRAIRRNSAQFFGALRRTSARHSR